MIHTYKMILWKKPELYNKDFETISLETFELLKMFDQFEMIYRPNYYTSFNKNKVNIFNRNYDDFIKQLNLGKIDNNSNSKLGYAISFFSSLNELESFSFQLVVGNKCDKFYNTLVITIPSKVDLYDEITANTICEMFRQSVIHFKPFWGCVCNKSFSQKYDGFLKNGKPTTVHWLNYWSNEIVDRIGIDIVIKTLDNNKQILWESGIYKIRKFPINVDDNVDMEYHKQLEQQLGFLCI